ncbi:MAG: class I SAM-dependent methyltransferase [bacterium]
MKANKLVMSVDYNDESYNYKSYWDKRSYEHNAEVIALKKLLPKRGKFFIDIGGGFGRLLPIYKDRFEKITIVDASNKILEQAKKQAESLRVTDITFKVSRLPFVNEVFSQFDCVLMVRVSHHLADLDSAISSLSKLMMKDGVFVFEFANKMHFLNVVKNLIKFNFNFFSKDPYKLKTFTLWHPEYVRKILDKNGFRVEEKLSVSNFRNSLIKKFIPERILLILESFFQKPFAYINFGPSIFIRARKL